MKLVLLIALSIISIFSNAQILNPGFETGDTSHWSFTPRPNYTIEIKGGQNANAMVIHSDISINEFQPFSQCIPIKKRGLYKVTLSVRIKSKKVIGNVGIWMHLQDSSHASTSFKNLKMIGTEITGDTEWKTYSLSLRSTNETQYILLGGHLGGVGTAYFDDFKLKYEEITPANPPLKIRRYETHLRRKIKRLSIVSNNIDWKQVKSESKEILQTISNYDELDPINDYYINLLRKKGDNHSRFSLSMKPTKTKKQNSSLPENYAPSADIINDSTAYLYIPGFSGTQAQATKYATQINDLIAYIDTTLSISYWVIDLRHNHGGNMYPMIAGLSPFFGKRTLGYFMNRKRKNTPWKSGIGKAKLGRLTLSKILAPHQLKIDAKKIAVLIGEETQSSGEITAISFTGLPNTALIGTKSGGYTTSNKPLKLKDGNRLVLASGYLCDINHTIIQGPLIPTYHVMDSLNEIDWVETTMHYFKQD
ncbi:MAG: S41 family peptidase [Crocinitomicaceae bacterium]|nr:S41 family peptidase [Crocinitomicaceae bacterium]